MAESGYAVADATRVPRASDHATWREPGLEGPTEEALGVERGLGGDLAARHAALLSDPRLISRFSQNQRGYGSGHVARVMAQLRQASPPTQSEEGLGVIAGT